MVLDSPPTIALIGAGQMGSKLAYRMVQHGAGTILTNLEGRSEATWRRATECGMKHASYRDIVSQATYILSVVPPSEAFAIAQAIACTSKEICLSRKVIFADCNAVNPETAKQIAQLFVGTGITFIDGAVVGGPPSDVYNPGVYICADGKDEADLDELDIVLRKYGLNPFSLKGEGSGVGDASAVKMANSGVVKGAMALFASMILASHASSPSTCQGLLHSLIISQPSFLDQLILFIPQMTPKAYRFVNEMQEVAKFGGDEGIARIYEGTAEVFQRIARAREQATPGDGGDLDLLLTAVEDGKKVRALGECKKADGLT
ncbi:hypothetical protein BDP27DRAFT_1230346 [Rhodocollybia butyracea]|uniref:6-phosphogluconate dehydrogenase C-terminal domain-like protein n=1 Tax=Rhodocollybia butyracea TaxID=206335 RepID=A0A9P5PJK0_9AGAR|nr:hypothetical protein BDP27DRAFT_1230346 [Rhodocollybia butyracea]